MRGISHRCDAHLVFGGRRAAGGADFGVRPRLRGNPAERVVAVSARRAKNVVIAFGKEVAALVLNHIRIAAFDCRQDGGHVRGNSVAYIPEVEIVRRANPDGGDFAGGVFGAVDVGGQPHAVAHGHQHLAIDDGQGFEFLLGLHALFFLCGREGWLLSSCDGQSDGRDKGASQEYSDGRFPHRLIPSRETGV